MLAADLQLSVQQLEDIRGETPQDEFAFLCHRLVRTNGGFDALDLALCVALACAPAVAALADPAALALDWRFEPPQEGAAPSRLRALFGHELGLPGADGAAWAQYELERGAAALAVVVDASRRAFGWAEARRRDAAPGSPKRAAYSPSVREAGTAAIDAHLCSVLHDLRLAAGH